MSEETQWFHEHSTEEAQEERHHLRIWVMRVAVLLAALGIVAWATKAYAEDIPLHVLEKDGVQIRLMDKPCVDEKSISQINPAYLSRFKAIESVWPERDGSRKQYAGCWAPMTKEEAHADEEVFILVFEDFTSGGVPRSEFGKRKGQSGT